MCRYCHRGRGWQTDRSQRQNAVPLLFSQFHSACVCAAPRGVFTEIMWVCGALKSVCECVDTEDPREQSEERPPIPAQCGRPVRLRLGKYGNISNISHKLTWEFVFANRSARAFYVCVMFKFSIFCAVLAHSTLNVTRVLRWIRIVAASLDCTWKAKMYHLDVSHRESDHHHSNRANICVHMRSPGVLYIYISSLHAHVYWFDQFSRIRSKLENEVRNTYEYALECKRVYVSVEGKCHISPSYKQVQALLDQVRCHDGPSSWKRGKKTDGWLTV